jgi:hypothetical protein
VSFSKADAAISFCSYFADLTDEEILEGQWDFEEVSELRRQARAVTDREDG